MTLRLLADVVMPLADDTVAAGRWRLNAGSEMICEIKGLNKGKPFRAVVDFASMKRPQARLLMLADHEPDRQIGYWDKVGVDLTGIYAEPHLAAPKDAIEAEVLRDSVKFTALVRNNVPIQASVGIEPADDGSWEAVKADEKIMCNGRIYDGAGDLPLFVLRGGELSEASLVTFGADDDTGRLAARRHSNSPAKGKTMADTPLKPLLAKFAKKHHGLIAQCVADELDEAAITLKVQAAETDERESRIKALETDLKTHSDRVAKLEASALAAGLTVEEDGTIVVPEKKDETGSAALAARGSKKGVQFRSAEGKENEKKPETKEPETVSAA